MRRIIVCGFVAAGFSVASGGLLARQDKVQPVGMVLGAGGTVTRDVRTAPVRPGDLLFAGDILAAGSTAVPFLFCPQKLRGAVAAKGRAVFEEKELSGAVESGKPVGSCLLPPVERLPVTKREYVAVMPELDWAAGRESSYEQSMTTLPDRARAALEAEMKAAEGGEAYLHAVRGTSLEKAGLLHDALEAYRAFAAVFDETAWVRQKIVEIERESRRKRSK